jgi:predicted GH43/DUF377 family glycosyl hydrolase
MRATGEGLVSSIVFRRGLLGAGGEVTLDPPSQYATSARPLPDKVFHKEDFRRHLQELGAPNDPVVRVLDELPEEFGLLHLLEAIRRIRRVQPKLPCLNAAADDMLWIAQANYELSFPLNCVPGEIVIFPATEYERQGMEDLRLVRFMDADGVPRYYGTYTAFDGVRMMPMLVETQDLVTFFVRTLSGKYIRNKGMALFPRKVGGQYLMVSRHDGENIYLLRSESIHTWNSAERLLTPRQPWELVQLGNCGSPIETKAGWILLTHGVGPMRQYCIGAALLDRDDPSHVVGRLREPLLVPRAEEREGYVPNVLYSCGSMVHNDLLVIPYAMADVAISFATVPLPELLARLQQDGA